MIGTLVLSLLAQGPAWKHSGDCWLLTTKEGADLPAGAVVTDFPVLLRLHPIPLHYQIEEWDAAAGRASVWVLLPRITGDARERLHLSWGNPAAHSESDGRAPSLIQC